MLTSCYFPGNVRELENCVRRTATLAHGQSIVANDFACRHDECLSSILWKKSADAADEFISMPIGRGAMSGKSAPVAAKPCPESCADRDAVNVAFEDDTVAADAYSATEASDGGVLFGPLDGDDAERARLVEAMETAGWVQAKAARLLGLSARQIGYALRKHNISVKKF
jgi:Nif-specific regulatory protein